MRLAIIAIGVVAPCQHPALADTRDDLAAAAQTFEPSALRLAGSDERPRGIVRWDGPIVHTAKSAQASSTIETMAFVAVRRIAEIARLSLDDHAIVCADGRSRLCRRW